MHAITHAFSQLALLHTLGILIPYPTFGIARIANAGVLPEWQVLSSNKYKVTVLSPMGLN
jgi:hypothetical protein